MSKLEKAMSWRNKVAKLGGGAYDFRTDSTWVQTGGIDYDYGLHLYTIKGVVVVVVRLLVHHSCLKNVNVSKGKWLHVKDFPTPN